MIKKDVWFKWTIVEKQAFENRKYVKVVAPSILSIDFTKDVLLYTFVYDHSLVEVLTKKDEKWN
jgi:hypothetical protein